MESQSSLSQDSILDNDPKIRTLIAWVRAQGGICNVEARRDKTTGVRGLYSSVEIKDEDTPLVQIPNKLIVSPLHVTQLLFAEGKQYKDVFKLCDVTFDPKYPFEPNDKVPTKLENVFAEYYQLTLFLIFERLKGDKSFWKPFLDYLPSTNETLFTIQDSQTVDSSSATLLMSEI